MERMLLATGVLSDAAIIAGPIGAGDFSLNNLKKQSLQQFYRVNGQTVTLDFDLGAAKLIDTIALIAHNAGGTANVQVTAGAVPGASTYDSGVLPAITGSKRFGKSLFFLFIPGGQAFRYWRIVLNAPDNTAVDIGRVYLSDSFQPSYNMVYGMQQGFIDPSQEYETVSGDSVSLKRKKRRMVDFTLEDLSEEETFTQLYPFDQLVGQTGDVLLVPKPDDTTYLQFSAIYGKIETTQPFSNTSWNRFSRQYKIKELLP